MRHLVSPGEEPKQRRRHTDQNNQSSGQVKDHPSYCLQHTGKCLNEQEDGLAFSYGPFKEQNSRKIVLAQFSVSVRWELSPMAQRYFPISPGTT